MQTQETQDFRSRACPFKSNGLATIRASPAGSQHQPSLHLKQGHECWDEFPWTTAPRKLFEKLGRCLSAGHLRRTMMRCHCISRNSCTQQAATPSAICTTWDADAARPVRQGGDRKAECDGTNGYTHGRGAGTPVVCLLLIYSKLGLRCVGRAVFAKACRGACGSTSQSTMQV